MDLYTQNVLLAASVRQVKNPGQIISNVAQKVAAFLMIEYKTRTPFRMKLTL